MRPKPTITIQPTKRPKRFPLTASGMLCVFTVSVLILGCGYAWYSGHVAPKDWIADCMIDNSREEFERCKHLQQLGDVDGNGVVDWHDAYVYDHCTRCPDCCVEGRAYTDEESEKWCGPDICPGRCCHCFQTEDGLWQINYTSFGSDDDPECAPVPLEDSGCGEGEVKPE